MTGATRTRNRKKAQMTPMAVDDRMPAAIERSLAFTLINWMCLALFALASTLDVPAVMDVVGLGLMSVGP
jgi:hypothetical protein